MKLFICNMHNDSNKGDLAILKATISVVQRLLGDCEVTVSNCDYPMEFVEEHDLHRWSRDSCDAYFGSFCPRLPTRHGTSEVLRLASGAMSFFTGLWLFLKAGLPFGLGLSTHLVPRRHKRAWLALAASDLVIAKGGSYLYSYGGARYLVFLFRMLLVPMIAARMGKDILYFGHSIGPVQGTMSRRFTRVALRKANAILLRERLSVSYVMENLCVEGPAIDLIPDLAFLDAPRELVPSTGDILDREGVRRRREKPVVGVTVRTWEFPGSRNPRMRLAQYKAGIVEIINFLKTDFGATIVFVPHCLEDLPFAAEIGSELKDSSDVHWLTRDYSLKELKDVLGALSVLVGTRIHSNILALTQSTPVVPIAYEKHKSYGIMEMAGLDSEHIFDISELDVPRMKDRLRWLLKHGEMSFLEGEIARNVRALNAKILNKAAVYLQEDRRVCEPPR